MDQFVSALVLISALISILSGVNGLPSLRRSAEPRHSLQEIVVFGDSISDNGVCLECQPQYLDGSLFPKNIGNAFKLTNGTWPADPAYFKGHFSNGPVWVEDLAETLGVKLNDFAIGGGM